MMRSCRMYCIRDGRKGMDCSTCRLTEASREVGDLYSAERLARGRSLLSAVISTRRVNS